MLYIERMLVSYATEFLCDINNDGVFSDAGLLEKAILDLREAKNSYISDYSDITYFDAFLGTPNIVYLRHKDELQFIKTHFDGCDFENWIMEQVEADRQRRERKSREPLIANPYTSGSFLRKSKYLSRFAIFGSSPQQDPPADDWDEDGDNKAPCFFKNAPTITIAVQLAELFARKGRIADKYITICDTKKISQAAILRGFVRSNKIEWVKPFNEEERSNAQRKADELYSEAGFENGWDNYSTARRLRNEAWEITMGDVNHLWAKHPEVISVFEN